VAVRYIDPEDEREPVLLTERVVCLTEQDGEPVAWVLGDDGLCRADGREGFLALDWQLPVVSTVGAWGWKVRQDNDDRVRDVDSWLIRGDGRFLAAVVGEHEVLVIDPDEDGVEFISSDDGPAE
jgi:hypothetical protein